MTQSTKDKIKQTVEYYERIHAGEFDAFKKGIRIKIDAQKNKFASTGKPGNSAADVRLLSDQPETLFFLLKNALTDDQWTEYQTKQGVEWFARTFPQYRVAEVV